MKVTQVCDGVQCMSVNVENILFEGIWPIPNGVSLNSYLVRGVKSALVDGVCGWDGVPETLPALFQTLGLDIRSLDYVIVNHMEPDHSGWLPSLVAIHPSVEILCSAKAVPLLKAFFGIEKNVRAVGDGDVLDLGGGRVIDFVEIPNVHWPETIASFDRKSGALFPCDAFGSFGSVGDSAFDDQLGERELNFFEGEAVRYYSNIVAAFSLPVRKAIEKAEKLLGPSLKIIAPGHGIVWRKNPGRIIDDYRRYVRYQNEPAKAEVTVIWSSMYGNTEAALVPVVEGLRASGVLVHEHRVPQAHIGDILTSVWTSSGIVIGTPSYEYKMFPPMAAVIDELLRKKVHGRLAFRFGSFGWCGGAQGELDELLAKYKPKWQFLPPVEFQGRAGEEDLAVLHQRGLSLGRAVMESVKRGAWENIGDYAPVDPGCDPEA